MVMETLLLHYNTFERSANALRKTFRDNEPPHVILDDAFAADQLAEASRHYPTFAEMNATTIGGTPTVDTQLADLKQTHAAVRRIAEAMMVPRFVAWLRDITGIINLCADPDDSWGVVRQYGNGVATDPRAPSRHKTKPFVRALSVVVFLTPEWQPEWGGNLQLWDASHPGNTKHSIVPLFNRMVVFQNAAHFFHMPEPSHMPAGVTRKNIVVWYYKEPTF